MQGGAEKQWNILACNVGPYVCIFNVTGMIGILSSDVLRRKRRNLTKVTADDNISST